MRRIPDQVIRPVSGMERAWIAATRVHPPFAIQVVFEGAGDVDVEAWRAAAATASVAVPGARAVLGDGMQWVVGPPCAVRCVDGRPVTRSAQRLRGLRRGRT